MNMNATRTLPCGSPCNGLRSRMLQATYKFRSDQKSNLEANTSVRTSIPLDQSNLVVIFFFDLGKAVSFLLKYNNIDLVSLRYYYDSIYKVHPSPSTPPPPNVYEKSPPSVTIHSCLFVVFLELQLFIVKCLVLAIRRTFAHSNINSDNNLDLWNTRCAKCNDIIFFKFINLYYQNPSSISRQTNQQVEMRENYMNK